MTRGSNRFASAFLGALAACIALDATAFSTGVNSSGPVNCNACHSGGATTPALGFTGDALLARGTSRVYTFSVLSGGSAGGLHVSDSAGLLLLNIGGPNSANTRLSVGSITHSSPRNFSSGSSGRDFSFVVTASATAACNTNATLTGWGLAANNNGATSGDAGNSQTRAIRIVCPPTITTTASPDTTLGSTGQLTDSATVDGRTDPVDGGSIDFRLYGPDDATCSGTPIFQSLAVPYPALGGAVQSMAFTPSAAGTYRWRAFYSGDANNVAVSGACNALGESVVVALPDALLADGFE